MGFSVKPEGDPALGSGGGFGLGPGSALSPAPWHSSHLGCSLRTVRRASTLRALGSGGGGGLELAGEGAAKTLPVGGGPTPPRGTGCGKPWTESRVGAPEGQEKEHPCVRLVRQGRGFSTAAAGEEQERGWLPWAALLGPGKEAGAGAARWSAPCRERLEGQVEGGAGG